jgi:cytochrome P450 family 150 subfamily A5
VTDLQAANFFRDRSVQDDPYPYFDALRAESPVWQEPHYGVFMVTGHDEALAVYNDSAHFSSCNAVSGPFMPFPEPFEGDDVSDVIERHRDILPFSDQLPAFDPPRHTAHRALMMRLLTPGRLRANEEFMAQLADRLLAELVAAGGCEVIGDYAAPFTLRVVADLEGVPEADHALFAERLTKLPEDLEHKPLEFLYEQFTSYIAERRGAPRDDIMTAMATATFPDGTTPEVKDVALLAANLFAGGQETTVRLLSFALRILAERSDIQTALRDDRARIPNFIEETLRYESPLRAQFRMAKVRTAVAGVDIPAGSTMMLVPGAANRDPRLFENPAEFDIDRANAKYHVAFGHGIHHCAGAHLARAEGRITVNRILDGTSNITISEDAHGPPDDRRYDYLPTYFLRGLATLKVELTPA